MILKDSLSGMEKKVELLPFLEHVMERTTTCYKEDFQDDMVRLRGAVGETASANRTFYWMARPCGTYIVYERNVFLRGTNGHVIWTHYADMSNEIRAYRLVVTGGSYDTPMGTVHKINYPEQVKRVMASAIPAVKVEISFPSGQVLEMKIEEYETEQRRLFEKYGIPSHIRYCPADEGKLQAILALERECQKRRRSKTVRKPLERPSHEK